MSELNLRPQDIDRLGQALLTLTQELWVVKDRLRIMEAALIDANVILPNAIDQYQPGEKLTALLTAERGELIKQMINTLAPESD